VKILISAYNCSPYEGSEPGIGWHTAWSLALHHDVLVLTQSLYREPIERFMAMCGENRKIEFVYLQLPFGGKERFRRKVRQIYYPLWQAASSRIIRKLVRERHVDLAHHLVWGRVWMASGILGAKGLVPLVWGPVGAIEKTPNAFLKGMGFMERFRNFVVSMTLRSKQVDRMVRAADLVLASSRETHAYLKGKGARDVRLMSNSGISQADADYLSGLASPPENDFVFLAMGRLLPWKGCQYALEAFARTDDPRARFLFLGEGPMRRKLERLAEQLGVSERVSFLGSLPRDKALDVLAGANVLVHPSLHDSGGLVCAEAMAAGRPVICLNMGGPPLQVGKEGGIVIEADNPVEAIRGIEAAMRRCLQADADLPGRETIQNHVRTTLVWELKAKRYAELYQELDGRYSL